MDKVKVVARREGDKVRYWYNSWKHGIYPQSGVMFKDDFLRMYNNDRHDIEWKQEYNAYYFNDVYPYPKILNNISLSEMWKKRKY